MALHFNQHLLQKIFQTAILPAARADKIGLAIAAPSWTPPAGVTITPQKSVPRLATSVEGANTKEIAWADLNLHCRPNPILLFILEGEADIRVGRLLDRESPQTGTARKTRDYEVAVYSIPALTCLIVPPDVAHSDGSSPHWERPHPENASSHIFWVQILPTGAIIHSCQTDGLKHTHISPVFVRDLQISPLMHFMLERAAQLSQSDAVMSSFLLTLLLCLDQSQSWSLLQEGAIPEVAQDAEHSQEGVHFSSNTHSGAFERACLYIGSHLPDSLSPGQIARHAHISISQLNRIFRAQLQIPVMQYVAQRRMEEAKSLLLRTTLTTQEVGEICGYPHRTHFSRVFKEQVGLSPLAFRRDASRRHEETPS